MGENERLVQELRRRGLGNGTGLGWHAGLCDAAADTLEEMQIQLAEKDKQIADLEAQHRVECCESAGYDCEVRGQLAAAVEDLEKHCRRCTHQIDDEMGCDCEGVHHGD